MRTLLLCVVLVCCGNAKDCLSQEQIDSKHYAVRIAKDYGTQEEVLERVLEAFGGRIHTLKAKEGSDFDIISLGSQGVKDFALYEPKRDSNGDVAWAYDEGVPMAQKGRLIAKIAYLDRFDDVVLIEASTPGSASIAEIVNLTLENGTNIEYAIGEDGLGSDRFYDEQGREYVECAALE